MRLKVMLLVVLSVAVCVPLAQAGAVLISPGGTIKLGVNDEGHIDLVSAGVGLWLSGVGDALIPGCPCEAWGVQANGQIGYIGADVGNSNIALVSFTNPTPQTAVSTTTLGTLPDLQVVQTFQPSVVPEHLFEVIVTMTNLSATTTLTGLQYSRAMDWDVPPTAFREFVTLGGWPATALLYSGDNGFARPFFDQVDLGTCGQNANFTDCGPADHGAYFIFGFGDLVPGASRTLSIFYGATYSEAAAYAALGAVGAEVYSLGQQSGDPAGGTPGTFIFGFKGVGGTPVPPGPGVPEPSTFLLLGGGLVALAARKLKR